MGDRELEENAIEGWIRQTPSTDEVPSTPAAKQLPTLRERSGTDPMISKNDAWLLQFEQKQYSTVSARTKKYNIAFDPKLAPRSKTSSLNDLSWLIIRSFSFSLTSGSITI